ncbi:ABC transporter ATP-binding protein [Streptomyces sp. NPDC005930]|uniref:ABC transporter ATP-binding protein n=1 Tax=Streptomyces sp. NPDC005930 TaxID=3364736 RepID=UPI003687D648
MSRFLLHDRRSASPGTERPATLLQPSLSLRRLVGGSRALLAGATAAACGATIAGLALPWAVKAAVAALARHQPVTGPVAWLAAAALGAAACQAGCGWLLARSEEQLVRRLRHRVAGHVLRLPLPVVHSHGAGDLTARITSDAALTGTVVATALVHLPVAAVGTVATLTVMACLDLPLTALAAGSFALAGLPLAGVLARTRRAATAQQEALARLAQRLTAQLAALTTLKAHRREAAAAGALDQDAADLGSASATAARLHALIGPLVGLGQQLALVTVTSAAAWRIASGALSPAAFSAFFFALLYLSSPLTVTALGLGQLRTGLAARSRLERLLTLAPESEAPLRARPCPPTRSTTRAAVTFTDVTFAHPGADPALRHLSFTVPTRGLTALTGPSGAGKSTVLALIGRFAHPGQGQIHVLGAEIGSWWLTDLRRRVAYLEQEPTVLEGTVRHNLRPGATTPLREADLWQALETVGLDEAVRRLPAKLDAPLGRGQDLSGGQRRRLALARVLLTEADLFLLDEPTSQLDPASEQQVLRALDRLSANRPVLVSTHQPATLRQALHTVTLSPPPLAAPTPHRPVSPVPSPSAGAGRRPPAPSTPMHTRLPEGEDSPA